MESSEEYRAEAAEAAERNRLAGWRRLARAMREANRSPRVPTSELLNDLLARAPGDQISFGWLIGSLGDRSFGIVILVLALLALLPGVSPVAGILLAIPAFQMLLARSGPVFPKRVTSRAFRTQQLGKVIRGAVPVLRYVERFVRPRWSTPFETTKRVVGAIVLLLDALLLAPVPLGNIPLAIIVMLIAVAYLEEDGLLLCAALVVAVLLLAAAAVAVWETMSAAGWVRGLL